MVESVFWVCVFFVIYPYLIYPLIVGVLGQVRPRQIRRAFVEPRVTILIPAYNEAQVIRDTVLNKIEQDYPSHNLEIFVISDASDDGTDEIVAEFEKYRVKLLRREVREGKAAALNEAVQRATGDIIVFSDANSIFARDAVRRIVMNFADPDVGYVTGSLGFLSPNGNMSGDGIGAYMRFENMLRRLETNAGSVIGVNGGIDAIRRELYSEIPKNLITDFVLPLRVLARGFRVVFDANVLSRESANLKLSSEFRMRVRVALRAMQGLQHMKQLFNPFRFPLISFCLFSHKLLRYMAFMFLIVAFVCNAILAISIPAYTVLLCFHLAGYTLALIGLRSTLPVWVKRMTVVPSYLLMTYTAFAVAAYKFLRGESFATWRPRGG